MIIETPMPSREVYNILNNLWREAVISAQRRTGLEDVTNIQLVDLDNAYNSLYQSMRDEKYE